MKKQRIDIFMRAVIFAENCGLEIGGSREISENFRSTEPKMRSRGFRAKSRPKIDPVHTF